ncbi:MAG: hypothetical protein ACFFCD_08865 [Promethearchaeota archaeon]
MEKTVRSFKQHAIITLQSKFKVQLLCILYKLLAKNAAIQLSIETTVSVATNDWQLVASNSKIKTELFQSIGNV